MFHMVASSFLKDIAVIVYFNLKSNIRSAIFVYILEKITNCIFGLRIDMNGVKYIHCIGSTAIMPN